MRIVLESEMRKWANESRHGIYLLSTRSVLLPTRTIITSLPLSVRTSSIHLAVLRKDCRPNSQWNIINILEIWGILLSTSQQEAQGPKVLSTSQYEIKSTSGTKQTPSSEVKSTLRDIVSYLQHHILWLQQRNPLYSLVWDF